MFCIIFHIDKKPYRVLLIPTECPELKKPRNGKLSCRKVSGKLLCIMSCDEDYSFNSEAMTMYGCGPDTNWKWNNMEKLEQPKCLSEYDVLKSLFKVSVYFPAYYVFGTPPKMLHTVN